MSQILLDVTRLLNRLGNGTLPTGVDRVGLEYIRHYGARARAVLSEQGFHILLSARDSERVFQYLLEQNTRMAKSVRVMAMKGLAAACRRERFDRGILLHTSHSGMEYVRYLRAMRRKGVQPVFMVHDLIPLTHAEYCRPGVAQTHRRRIHVALDHAAGIIANSKFTLDSLLHEANTARKPLPPSVIARLAPGIDVCPPRAKPLDSPYFVMLGTIEPRKNHWFMLHLWRTLVEKYGSTAPKLVIIGRRGWECENVIDMLERCSSVRDVVVEESNCSDERLQAWIQHARALLFPSFVEGYGMPLVESLMLGVPVLASDLPVFHEIASDIPDYLDPLDGPGWMTRIEAYSQPESPVRDAQLKRIERFRAPTWSEHFDGVDGFLESLG